MTSTRFVSPSLYHDCLELCDFFPFWKQWWPKYMRQDMQLYFVLNFAISPTFPRCLGHNKIWINESVWRMAVQMVKLLGGRLLLVHLFATFSVVVVHRLQLTLRQWSFSLWSSNTRSWISIQSTFALLVERTLSFRLARSAIWHMPKIRPDIVLCLCFDRRTNRYTRCSVTFADILFSV